MLHNSKGKLKTTNQNLLVSDPAVICVSQIILKCLLMCATLSFFFFLKDNPSYRAVNSVISLSFYLVTSISLSFFFFPKLLHRHSAFAHHILHNKIQLINAVFLGWKSCVCSPALLVITLNECKPCCSDLHCPLASLPPSKYDCSIFSTHLHDRIKNNVFIQIKHQL